MFLEAPRVDLALNSASRCTREREYIAINAIRPTRRIYGGRRRIIRPLSHSHSLIETISGRLSVRAISAAADYFAGRDGGRDDDSSKFRQNAAAVTNSAE